MSTGTVVNHYRLEDGEHAFLSKWQYVRAADLAPEGKWKGIG
jgi:hypothetical protein